MIVAVPRDQIWAAWKDAEPFIVRALSRAHGEFDKTDVLQFLLSTDMQLWLYVDGSVRGAAVTQIINFPRYRIGQVFLLSGDEAISGTEWMWEMIETIKRWAKQNGCAKLREVGRRGWNKVCGDKLGAKEIYTTMEIDI